MTEIDAFAQKLVRAHRMQTAVAVDQAPLGTPEDAYAVQSQVAAAIGRVGGFKVAARPGVPPTMAPILESGIVASGKYVSAAGAVGVELEIGFRVVDPTVLRHHQDAVTLANAVQPVLVIELVGTRLEGPAAADPLAKLADFQTNAGLVVGPDLDGWDGRDIGHLDIDMRSAEMSIYAGASEVPGGSAIRALHCLANMVGDHCGGLRPGQYVITGSLHPLTYVDPPCVVRGWADGFGEVLVTLSRQPEAN